MTIMQPMTNQAQSSAALGGRRRSRQAVACLAVALAILARAGCSQPAVEWWSSSEDLKHRLTPQPALKFAPDPSAKSPRVDVDETTTRGLFADEIGRAHV